MKTHLALVIMLSILVLSACVVVGTPGAGDPKLTPQPTAPAGPTPAPTQAPPEPTIDPGLPAGIVKVQAAVAAQLGVAPGALTIVRWGEVQWPDSCLGMNVSEKPCLQVITPGYLIIFEHNGTQIEVHSNLDGSDFGIVPAEGIPDPAGAPAFVDALRQKIAAELGIADPKMLRLVDFEAVQWPDSCLGVRTGKPCLDVITPGYRLWFKVNDDLYAVHTNEDGSKYVIHPNVLPAWAADLRGMVGHQLGLATSAVKLDRGEKVEWPDSCLGVSDTQMACLAVVTPGYKLFYLAGGQEIEVHTNEDGTVWKLAGGPQGDLIDAVIRWQGEVEGTCARLQLNAGGWVAWGKCEGALQTGGLIEGKRQAELAHFLAEYTPVIVDGINGGLQFNGQGTRPAEDAELRALDEWAQLVWLEQMTGRAGEPMATWTRQGGTGNACDKLALYASGVYYTENCKSQNPAVRAHYLTAAQLDELYTWLDKYAPFDVTGEPAADGATPSLIFAGRGAAAAPEAEGQAIVAWAAELYRL